MEILQDLRAIASQRPRKYSPAILHVSNRGLHIGRQRRNKLFNIAHLAAQAAAGPAVNQQHQLNLVSGWLNRTPVRNLRVLAIHLHRQVLLGHAREAVAPSTLGKTVITACP